MRKSSNVPRRPYPHRGGPARRGGLRARRARHIGRWLLLACVFIAGVVAIFDARLPYRRHHGVVARRPGGSAPAIESGILPWSLPAPVSRAVALRGGRGKILIFGGSTPGNGSARGIYSLDTRSGKLSHRGALAVGLHDAAGAEIGGRSLIFGGGAPAATAAVEVVDVSKAARARVSSSLPHRRADAAAVRLAGRVYVVGGSTGTNSSSVDAEVLATKRGGVFSPVARLPVPVRYPAVAALDGRIYVFGGVGAGGLPVEAVQVVDPRTGSARLVGSLPIPLEGATAAALDGRIYVAGGATTRSAALTGGYRAPSAARAAGGRLVTVGRIWSFNRARRRFALAGRLRKPVAHAASVAVGNTLWMVGGEYGGRPVGTVQVLRPNRGFGVAGKAGAGSPFFGGRLLIADRGNNRLLLLNDRNRIVWRYPSPSAPAPPGGFTFPDDAFFENHGHSIISNEEQNEVIVRLSFPSGKLLWSYGHPGKAGSAAGYLHEPDDAYLLPDRKVVVADAYNCRLLFIAPNHRIAGQIGTTGRCRHDPPRSLGVPNAATPLANGNILTSEIRGSWISEYTRSGKLVWTVKLPIAYPSDPQKIGPDRYLVSDYSRPGAVVEFNRAGTILYRYGPRSGPGMLDHPSLAELLPSGVLMVNDDYHDRMVAIDPKTGAIVWQYGVDGKPGRSRGLLKKPDGFDLLMPGGATPTHLQG